MLKTKENVLTEEFLSSLVGKLIHVPTNEHETEQELTGEKTKVNVWFAGVVAGYTKSHIAYNFDICDFISSKEYYQLILTDGMCYILASDCEIEELTEEEFAKMVEDFQRSQDIKNSIILPDGKVF